jgi:hypothetical protein
VFVNLLIKRTAIMVAVFINLLTKRTAIVFAIVIKEFEIYTTLYYDFSFSTNLNNTNMYFYIFFTDCTQPKLLSDTISYAKSALNFFMLLSVMPSMSIGLRNA